MVTLNEVIFDMKELLVLFLTFAKVGVMTFGGGYAMLPILQREVVENTGWATDEELTDYFAIGQCHPRRHRREHGDLYRSEAARHRGRHRRDARRRVPVAGDHQRVMAGVIAAFSHLTWVAHAFAGVRVCVCVLIFNAVLKLMKSSVKDKHAASAIFAVTFVLWRFCTEPLPRHAIVLAAALAGVLIQSLKTGGAKK